MNKKQKKKQLLKLQILYEKDEEEEEEEEEEGGGGRGKQNCLRSTETERERFQRGQNSKQRHPFIISLSLTRVRPSRAREGYVVALCTHASHTNLGKVTVAGYDNIAWTWAGLGYDNIAWTWA
ncbi:hypothetical protein CMV_013243 [Castanea mollissima]|uniref:Uncharacterized protein n=1 Tax=Castanea mollissima TaxID=60419 RepID=A0A8J4R8B8_9ROSI|nr:hypothetical protein CMV_013243 [Castanea mollissima]